MKTLVLCNIFKIPGFAFTFSQAIGYFRVPKTLSFKMRPRAKPFLWKILSKSIALNLVLIQRPNGTRKLPIGSLGMIVNIVQWSWSLSEFLVSCFCKRFSTWSCTMLNSIPVILNFILTNNDLLVLKQWIGALNPIFRIMPSIQGLLKNYNLALSARSLFLRRPRSLGIILYKLSMLSIVNVSGMF